MGSLKNDLFLRACKGEPIERTPIWIMRQAGRYLPEYRAIREKSDFLTMCKTPELAAEVTLQPVDIISVDAAILFSDILVIPEAMGMELIMEEKKGPVFSEPIRNADDVNKLKVVDPTKELKYVMNAISKIKKELNDRVPLIGFSGSPWTLFTYMVEGKGSKNFSNVKRLLYNNPKLSHFLLEKITDTVSDYLSAQISEGVDAVQIFDTWGGILSQEDYNEFSLRYIKEVISKVKRKDQPVIIFSKGAHYAIDELAESGADVIGLDWTMNIGEVRNKVGNKISLQGNMDPTLLYAPNVRIKSEVENILSSYGEGSRHIFNLGHGILPDVDPENVKELVKYVKDLSVKYHKNQEQEIKTANS